MVALELPEELLERIKAKLSETDVCVYWDYRDELSTDQIARIIKDTEYEVENEVCDNMTDHIYELERNHIKETLDLFKNEIPDYDKEALYDEYRDELIDSVTIDYQFKDLCRNTGKQVFFYDTGHQTDYEWNSSDAKLRLERYKIKKTLSITTNKYDAAIEMMLMQGYSGNLVIYFRSDVSDLMPNPEGEDNNFVTFEDAYIAIINTSHGSGDHMDAPGHKFKLPFNRDNLFLCKSIKYSYTYNVCGMSSDWCDETKFKFSHEIPPVEIPTSSINAHLVKEAAYNKTYKEGGCTPGDMDYLRHRNRTYINNYPCGNKCLDCNTFWID